MSKDLFAVEPEAPVPDQQNGINFYYIGGKEIDNSMNIAFAEVVMKAVAVKMEPGPSHVPSRQFKTFAEYSGTGLNGGKASNGGSTDW